MSENTILKQRGQKLKQMETEIVNKKQQPTIEQKPVETPIETPVEQKPIEPAKAEKVKKPRKPKTAGQMEAFKKVVEKRQAILKQNKLEKQIEASKILLQNNVEIPTKTKTKKEKKVKEILESSTDESESEPEIIIKKKHKKKKKPITIHVEESSSSESEEDKKQPVQKQVQEPSKQFVSQQNKKSLINIVPNKNYFVD
jgi:hypothetical protein